MEQSVSVTIIKGVIPATIEVQRNGNSAATLKNVQKAETIHSSKKPS